MRSYKWKWKNHLHMTVQQMFLFQIKIESTFIYIYICTENPLNIINLAPTKSRENQVGIIGCFFSSRDNPCCVHSSICYVGLVPIGKQLKNEYPESPTKHKLGPGGRLGDQQKLTQTPYFLY